MLRYAPISPRKGKFMSTPECPAEDGSSPRQTSFSGPPPMCIDPSKAYTATMQTSLGSMVIHLDAVGAPNTVNNFVFLARYHYYDSLIFHRIINGFMCQGGCPEGSGSGGPGYRFADELPAPGRYEIGSIAMANAGPDTNGSQFFIVHGADVGLPPNYTIFGNLTGGEDVLDAIANSPVTTGRSGEPSTPTTPLEITDIEIQES